MAETIQLRDYITFIRDAVKYYPEQSRKCLQPQTFAVLETDNDLSAEQLGKSINDRYLPFFYSRRWEKKSYKSKAIEWEFPAVFLFETSATVDNAFECRKSFNYTVQLMVVDKFLNKQTNPTINCNGRVRNQIYEDTEYILTQVLNYLFEIVYANTNIDSTYTWYHRTLLSDLQTAGKISSYSIQKRLSTILSRENGELTALRFDGGLADLFGTLLTFTLPVTKEESETFDFDEIVAAW